MRALALIGVGFVFWHFNIPERWVDNKWVHLLVPGHAVWHVLVFMNGYKLYWLLYEGMIHVESNPHELGG